MHLAKQECSCNCLECLDNADAQAHERRKVCVYTGKERANKDKRPEADAANKKPAQGNTCGGEEQCTCGEEGQRRHSNSGIDNKKKDALCALSLGVEIGREVFS